MQRRVREDTVEAPGYQPARALPAAGADRAFIRRHPQPLGIPCQEAAARNRRARVGNHLGREIHPHHGHALRDQSRGQCAGSASHVQNPIVRSCSQQGKQVVPRQGTHKTSLLVVGRRIPARLLS